jgi:hypothetical protein
MRHRVSLVIAVVLLSAGLVAAAPPSADTFLYSGRLADGEKKLAAQLERFPNDDSVRFGLGSLQFVRAVEHLSQSLYRYGLGRTPFMNSMPMILRLPVPANPNPEAIDYPAQCRIFQTFLEDLAKVEATLSKVSDGDFKVPIDLTRVQFDPTGEGKPVPITGLLDAYFAANRRPTAQFAITFDAGDAHWLRGYCHLLSALCEVVLAHDMREIFDHTAHLFFPKAKTPFPFLAYREDTKSFDFETIVDAITAVHLLRLPVVEKDRMKSALAHLKGMIAESRAMWKCVLAETDDDHEWIPNPRQTGVTGTKVTDEMVKGWMTFLDEADALLDGRKLVPFWRGNGSKGVNLRRAFEDPRQFDLVLWVQGTAAVPYLEDGPVTTKETWTRLQRIFQGDFIGFAFWFN